MPEPVDAKSDCYSAKEREWMEFGQQLRASWLSYLLVWLTRFGVTPDTVTLVAAMVGLAFVPLWLVERPGIALMLLLLHVLLDGLDGPLARYQRLASARGSFTDTFADQMVVTAVSVAWMIHSPSASHIAAGALYIFLYALVVAMAMVRNALAVPYSWLVRPRFFVYLSIAADCWLGRELALITFTLCDCLLAIKCVSGFLALRGRLRGPSTVDENL